MTTTYRIELDDLDLGQILDHMEMRRVLGQNGERRS